MKSHFIKCMKLQIHLFNINGQRSVDFIQRGAVHQTLLLRIQFFSNYNLQRKKRYEYVICIKTVIFEELERIILLFIKSYLGGPDPRTSLLLPFQLMRNIYNVIISINFLLPASSSLRSHGGSANNAVRLCSLWRS